MRKRQYIRLIFLIIASILLFLGILGIKLNILKSLCLSILLLSCLLFFVITLVFLLENKIYKGCKYAFLHWRIKNNLEKELIEAGFGQRKKHYFELPKITLEFNKVLTTGIIKIKNSIKFNNKLDDTILSAALYDFIVTKHYITRNCNQYVYELTNSLVSYKMNFRSIEEFADYNKTIPEYSMFLDSHTKVKLKSTLLVGLTGSGKTYGLFSLILQLLNKHFSPHFYIVDPKNSSLKILGNRVSTEKVAVKVNEFIELLEVFNKKMEERKKEIEGFQEIKLTGDYSDFNFKPHILVIDEFTALAAQLSTIDKTTRERAFSILHNVFLEGRQLGFFVFIIMQKSDSNYIPTALRENIPLKIVFGNSGEQTYKTAFGSNTKVPNYNFELGEGVFTDPDISNEPEIVQFPTLDFDILGAIEYLKRI